MGVHDRKKNKKAKKQFTCSYFATIFAHKRVSVDLRFYIWLFPLEINRDEYCFFPHHFTRKILQKTQFGENKKL